MIYFIPGKKINIANCILANNKNVIQNGPCIELGLNCMFLLVCLAMQNQTISAHFIDVSSWQKQFHLFIFLRSICFAKIIIIIILNERC